MRDLTGHYVLVGLPGIIPRAISHYTRSWANHVGIMISPTHLVEAWVPRVHVRPLSDYDHLRTQFNVSDELTPRQRAQIVEYALAAVGRPYDLVAFGALAAAHLLRAPAFPLPLSPLSVICSHLVARAATAAGLDYSDGHALHAVTPATLAQRISYNRTVTMGAPAPAPASARTSLCRHERDNWTATEQAT